MVRLLSLAILMALSLFILLVPIGSNEFGQIISKMNNNALNIPESQKSVYNLEYDTGFNVVDQLFFSLTILFTAMSVAGILLRIGNTGIAEFVSAILNLLTGMLLLFARIWESSVSMHAMIDSVYLDGVVKEQIKTTQLLDKVPVLYILLNFCVKSSPSVSKACLTALLYTSFPVSTSYFRILLLYTKTSRLPLNNIFCKRLVITP